MAALPEYGEVTHRRPFSKVLRMVRQKKCLSQEQLALEAGMDRTTIGRLERGEREPALETVFILAKALRIKASEIVALME